MASLLQRIRSLTYPLVNYPKGPTITWPPDGGIRINGIRVSNDDLYCYFLDRVLCINEIENQAPFPENGSPIVARIARGNGLQGLDPQFQEDISQSEYHPNDSDDPQLSITQENALISLLERYEVRKQLTKVALNSIDHQRNLKKSSKISFDVSLKYFKEELSNVIIWACYHNFLSMKDIRVFIRNLASFGFVSDILISPKWSRMEFMKNKQHYKPWFLVIRSALISIEEQDHPMELFTQDEVMCIDRVLQNWLLDKRICPLFNWLIQFLFTDCIMDIKRKFLYLFGEAGLGKSTFIEILFNSKYFLTQIFSTDFYCSHDRGEYISHCVIFDDPAKITNYNTHILSGDFFVRLARGGEDNQLLTFQTKHGFVKIHKAQVCLISNENLLKLFPLNHLSAMKTRVLQIEITNDNMFPLVFLSPESYPVEFELHGEEEEEEEEHPREQHHFEEEKENIFEEEKEDIFFEQEQNQEPPRNPNPNPNPNPNLNPMESQPQSRPSLSPLQTTSTFRFLGEDGKRIQSDRFKQHIIFYFLWRSIIHVLGETLKTQNNEVLNYIFGPNADLKQHLFSPEPENQMSFYERFLSYSPSRFKFTVYEPFN